MIAASFYSHIKQTKKEYLHLELTLSISKLKLCILIEVMTGFPLWHFRLWSFQGRDTKLERFLAKKQLYSNAITKF
jgi:hypothetical protein